MTRPSPASVRRNVRPAHVLNVQNVPGGCIVTYRDGSTAYHSR